MHIRSPRAPRRFVVRKEYLIVLALGLAMASFGPTPYALAQGAIGPMPKSPAVGPAPIAPAPHVVPPPLPPPTVAPANPSPFANQPTTTGPGEKKSTGASSGGDAFTATVTPPVGTRYAPLPNIPLTVANKAGGAPLRIATDGKGGFNFGKLAPGSYTLEAFGGNGDNGGLLFGNGGAGGAGTTGQPPILGVLVALLLPAVQKVREAGRVEHTFLSGNTSQEIKIALDVGTDGRVISIDWGDGSGAIDPAKEARSVPLPQGAQPGELHGTLAYTGTTTVNPGTLSSRASGPGATARGEFYTLLLGRPAEPGGARSVAVADINGDGKPDLQIEPNGTFTVRKLPPGDYFLGIADNDSPRPQDRVLLVALLLPAVQKARETTIIEHQFNAGEARNISLRMGHDGRIMRLDWGKGPVDLTKEARRIPLPQDASPGVLRLSLSPLPSSSQPQGIAGVPIDGTDVGLDHNPGGGISVSKTDNAGGFSFTKVGPGTLTLSVVWADYGQNIKAAAVLIGLLLPSVGTARGNYVEHAFTGDSLGRNLKIGLRIGKDGRIMTIDWGDGQGAVDPAKEARSLPLPKGALAGELRGRLDIFRPVGQPIAAGRASAHRRRQPERDDRE